MLGTGQQQGQPSGPALLAGRRPVRLVVVAGEGGGGAAQTTLLGRRLGLGSRMVVHALRLEEDGVLRVSPEVRHRVAAVASTGHYLQATVATSIGTRFTCKH